MQCLFWGPFVRFLLTIVLSVLRFTDSDYLFSIFKLFLQCMYQSQTIYERLLRHNMIYTFFTQLHIIFTFIHYNVKDFVQLKTKIANDIKYCFFFMQVLATKAQFSLLNENINLSLSDNELK